MSRNLVNWSERPELGAFVMQQYAQLGPSDTARQIQERYGVFVQPDTVRKYHSRRVLREGLEAGGLDVSDPVDPGSIGGDLRPDQRNPESWEDLAEFYDRVVEESERREATFLGQTQLTVDRSAQRLPVGVCFWSDWQLGANGVMLRQLKADAEVIRQTDGLYTFVTGDLIQNFNAAKHPYALPDCILPDPRDQIKLVRWVLNRVGPEKIEGMVTGNHEYNSKRGAGLSPCEEWAREMKVPYLWHGGVVTYKVGAQSYTLGIRHKFRGESGINTTNAQRTMYEQWAPADVEVLGHLHYNDLQKRRKPGRETTWLRSGSYLKWDDHAMDAGGFMGSWGIPIIILYPDDHRVLPIYGADFYTGLRVLAAERQWYREQQAPEGNHGGE
jgi:hypothetical protein